MSIGESFTTEKEKKFVHAVAFKIGDEGLFKLDSCFQQMKVKGKRRSDRMRDFINHVYALIEEHRKIVKENKSNSKQLSRLEKMEEKYAKLTKEKGELQWKLNKSEREKTALMKALTKLKEPDPIVKSPQAFKGSTETKPVTPSETPSKPIVSKEKSKEIEKPKPGECLRKIRTFQWDVQCKTCRDRHPLDYAKCDAPQKPEGQVQYPLKRW